MNYRKLQVIAGGQAGSEGKGHVAAILAAASNKPLCIRVAGPNAGHTVVNPISGKPHALRQIPVGAVTNPDARLAIAAGSEIDLEVLHAEIASLEDDGVKVRERLVIDPAATILTPWHKEIEGEVGLVGRIGSTGKGIGAARADRIMRTADTVRAITDQVTSSWGAVADVAAIARLHEHDVQVEGTQGYLLGLHTDNYPQTTSSDCTAIDFLAMARVNPWDFAATQTEIWLVFRPYPIRVAGNSGPLTGETTWEQLNLPVELTTVTKKVRRVGVWDPELTAQAVQANTGTSLGRYRLRPALTMADQIDPGLAGATDVQTLWGSEPYQRFSDMFNQAVGAPPCLVTTSDRTHIRLDQTR